MCGAFTNMNKSSDIPLGAIVGVRKAIVKGEERLYIEKVDVGIKDDEVGSDDYKIEGLNREPSHKPKAN